MAETATTTSTTPKGQRRRQAIIEGAAEILRVQGPAKVSHRAVAHRVGCSLSATTYYFSGLEELLEAAARFNIARWAARAEHAAEEAERAPALQATADQVELVLAATLPTDEELLGHYHQLTGAGTSPPVRRAYRTGRDRLNAAVSRVLARTDIRCSAAMVIAVVDGAAISALSEGRDVRRTASALLVQLVEGPQPD